MTSWPVFISCSPAGKDLALLAQLDRSLVTLERHGVIRVFHRDRVRPGEDVPARLAEALEEAQVILLLVSPEYLGDDASYAEAERAMVRRSAGTAQVLPVLLRPCEWKEEPFGRLKPLPEGGQPVTLWDNDDAAWASVARGVRAAVEALRAPVVTDGAASERAPDDGAEPWNPLLQRVARVFQLRESQQRNQTTLVTEPAPPPFHHYLDVCSIAPLGHAVTFALGAVTGTVNEEIIEAFAVIHARYGRPGSGIHSTLVYEGDRATQGLVRRARAHGVRLVSLIDYEELIDFGAYLKEQTARLAGDRVYPPGLFVPQRFRYTLGMEEHSAEDALATLEEWLDAPYGRLLLVLGEFGTGKTFLLHELARRLGEQAGPLVPILIELRALEKARDFEVLVAQHLTLKGVQSIDLPAFRYMLEQGRVVLLFDGFDELAQRVSYDRAAEHFDTLLQAVGGDAKVVISSRTQHFLSDRQIRTALGEKAADRGFRMVKLEGFNQVQIRQFLVRRFGSEEIADRRLALLERIRDLMGLSETPRMLSFIAELEEEKLNEACRDQGEISAAGLYQMLLDRWLGYEFDRAHPKGAPPGLSLQQRWRAVTELALLLWRRTERSIRITELPERIHESVKALAAPEAGQAAQTHTLDGAVITHQVGSGTLLRRDDGDSFSFLHQSVLEWLVARAAAAEVKEGGGAALLGVAEMSELMADFFSSLAGRGEAIAWAQTTLEAEEAPDAARKNALLVLRRLGVEARRRLNLAGQDLRGRDLSGRDLGGVDLTGADLTEARLVGARLDRASLRGARLSGANLSGASAVSAVLDGADLTGALLLGADLRGARFTRAHLALTALVGARVDPEAFRYADVEPEARLGPLQIEPCASSAGSGCAAVTYSPDGLLVASGHADALVRVWNVRSRKLIRELRGHDGRVNCVAFIPGSRTLVSGSADGTIRVWDLVSGGLLRVHRDHSGSVTCVAVSPDGRRMVSGSRDRRALVWSLVSGEMVSSLQGHEGWITAVAFCSSGWKIVSGAFDRTVRLWDAISGDPLWQTEVGGLVRSLAYSAEVNLIAVGSEDRQVSLIEAQSGRVRRTLARHTGVVQSVAFSPEGSMLASGSEDTTVQLWDVDSGDALDTLHEQGGVTTVAFSPDGTHLVSGSQRRHLGMWHTKKPQREQMWSSAEAPSVSGLAFGDGSTLVLGGANMVQRWDTRSMKVTETAEAAPSRARQLALTDGGACILILDDTGTVRERRDDETRYWRMENAGPIRALAVSAGGWIAAGKDAVIDLYSRDSRARALAFIGRMQGHQSRITGMAFDRDGTFLASASQDRTIRLWSIPKGKEVGLLEGHGDIVHAVACTFDKKAIASGSGDGTLRVWRGDSGRESRCVLVGAPVRSVAFHPTRPGTDWLLAAGSDTGAVLLYDTMMENPAHLYAHTAPVTGVAFTPDGRLLASSSRDGTARLWHVATRTLLATLIPRPEGWAAFTPDGRYKVQGDIRGAFWHVVGLCRFEPGELDPYLPAPLRVPDGEPLFTIPPDPELPPAESPTSPSL